MGGLLLTMACRVRELEERHRPRLAFVLALLGALLSREGELAHGFRGLGDDGVVVVHHR